MSHMTSLPKRFKVLPLVLLLSACQSAPAPKKSIAVEQSFLKKEQISRDSNEQSDDEKRPQNSYQEYQIASLDQLQMGAPLLTQLPRFATSDTVKVSISEMELPQLAHYVFGELLKLNYVISPEVEKISDKVALSLKTEVSPAELFKVTREIMLQQGVEVYSKDDIVYLAKRERSNANRSVGIGASLNDLPESGDDILQLIPFTYNSSRSIMTIASKLTAATISQDSANKLLVVEGTRADVERVVQIVGMLDVPSARGKDIRMMSLVYMSPTDLIANVTKLLEAEGLQIGEDIALVPLARLNAVVTFAANKALGDRVSSWARTLDVATYSEESRFYVYRPQFAKAEDLASSLSSFIEQPKSAGRDGNTEQQEGQNSQTSSPAAKTSNGVSIKADKSQNALVIRATSSQYRDLLSLLEQLDRLPGQVALQVVVIEVKLDESVESGLDYLYDSNGNKPASGTATLSPVLGSISGKVINGDWTINLRMLQSKTNSRILSRPYLVVKDGESANINSGDQVPIITSTNTSTQTPGVVTTEVQYRSTGTNLSVTPQINADGLVSLQISQESSSAKASSNIGVTTPTITTRSLSTAVLAANGQTVVLGGLIREDSNLVDQQLPLLGDLPLIGRLFQQKGDSKERTELMVLITPRIVRNTTELDEFGRKLAELYSFPIKP